MEISKNLDIKDYIVFFVYFIIVASYGIWIYKRKKSATADSKDYFLAEGSLTWWAIGTDRIKHFRRTIYRDERSGF